MEIQLWAVAVVIGLACVYLFDTGRQGWRRMRQGKCGTSCGCPSKPKSDGTELIETTDLTARLRNKRQA